MQVKEKKEIMDKTEAKRQQEKELVTLMIKLYCNIEARIHFALLAVHYMNMPCFAAVTVRLWRRRHFAPVVKYIVTSLR